MVLFRTGLGLTSEIFNQSCISKTNLSRNVPSSAPDFTVEVSRGAEKTKDKKINENNLTRTHMDKIHLL